MFRRGKHATASDATMQKGPTRDGPVFLVPCQRLHGNPTLKGGYERFPFQSILVPGR